MNNEGFFSKLLKGIVSPAARLSVAQQKFSNKLFGGTGQIEDPMARSILGNQKYQAVQQNPLTEGLLKPLASGASYGVQAAIAPIKGAGLLANAGRLGRSGAVAGGLAGLGESAQGNELNSIGSGAATGAVLNLLTGGLLKKENLKASQAVQKLDDISLKSIFKGTSPEQLKINKVTPVQFQTVAKDVVNRAKNISGKSTIDATDLYNIKNDVVNDAASEINKYSDKIVPNFKVKLGKAFAKEFESKIDTYDKLLKDDTFREAIDGFKSMSAKTTVGDARALWQKLLESSGGFEKVVRGAGKGTNESKLVEKLAAITRDSIKTASPEVSQAMKKFSTVNELLDVFTKNYSKTQTAGSVLNKGIFDEALQDVVNIPSVKAKGAQSIANLLRGRGEGEAQRSLLNMTSPSIGGGMVGSVGGESPIGIDPTLQGGQQANQPQSLYQLNLPSSQNGLYSALLQAAQLLPGGSVAQQYELAQGILEQNKAGQGMGGLVTVEDVVNGAIPDGKLTDNDKDYVQARLALEDALNYVESEGGAGKISTIGGNIAGFFGKKTSSSQYRAKVQNAVATLRKALIGAGQTESEMKNLNMPNPSDEPALAAEKIRAIISDISRRPVGAGQSIVTQ